MSSTQLPSEKLISKSGVAAGATWTRWILFYNNERPHSGRYCLVKTPMQTFIESLTLAKEKQLNHSLTAVII